MKKRILITSLLSIMICFCLITGATYALFTSESKVNVAITSGKVDVTAEANNFVVYSGKWNEQTLKYDSVKQDDLTFATNGNVTVEGNNITITNIVPMDKLTFDIVIQNKSNVNAKYQTIFTAMSESEVNLLDALEITIVEENESLTTTKVGSSVVSNWVNLKPKQQGEDLTVTVLNVTIYLPENVGNEYQDLVANLTYSVNAIQQNAYTVDPEVETDENTLYIYSKEDLKDVANLVNNGNGLLRKTVKLMAPIDLNNEEWTPIGTQNSPFKGTFDGNNQTISNLKITSGASNVGLFGFTTDGEIKNLQIRNASVKGYLNVGVVSGTPYTSKYTNIKVLGDIKVEGFAYVGTVGGKNAYADWTDIVVDVNKGSYVKANSVSGQTYYRTYVGGVVGFIGEGPHTFKNISSNIDVYGSTCDVGGITGIAHYNNTFENCTSSGNVSITNSDDLDGAKQIGGIAGVWHNENGTKVTLINCSFTGALTALLNDGTVLDTFANNGLVGTSYNETGTGELVIK